MNRPPLRLRRVVGCWSTVAIGCATFHCHSLIDQQLVSNWFGSAFGVAIFVWSLCACADDAYGSCDCLGRLSDRKLIYGKVNFRILYQLSVKVIISWLWGIQDEVHAEWAPSLNSSQPGLNLGMYRPRRRDFFLSPRNNNFNHCKPTFPCGCHSILVSACRFGSFVPQLVAACFLRPLRLRRHFFAKRPYGCCKWMVRETF